MIHAKCHNVSFGSVWLLFGDTTQKRYVLFSNRFIDIGSWREYSQPDNCCLVTASSIVLWTQRIGFGTLMLADNEVFFS